MQATDATTAPDPRDVDATTAGTHVGAIVTTGPLRGRPIRIGTGFSALSFTHGPFEGSMDPLVMVDHFTMTESTFGVHPHAGISAVSVLFEDTSGRFHNRDSLGHDLDLAPGDLYWLKAASGVVHDERPRPGARIHGLQIFVNLPATAKHDAPEALHVRAEDVPQICDERSRVRVLLGQSHGVSGPTAPAPPLTLLDVHLEAGGSYSHPMPPGVHTWVLAIGGSASVSAGATVIPLGAGHAVAARAAAGAETVPLTLSAETGAHLVLMQGQPLGEPMAQRGGFVMNTDEELGAVEAAHASGGFGAIA